MARKNKSEGDVVGGEPPESETKISTTQPDVCQVVNVNKTAKPPVKVDTISNIDKRKKCEEIPKASKIQEDKQNRVENKQNVQQKSNKSKSEVKYEHKKPKEEEKERPTHVVDPFFITESGQPYLSTAVVMSDDNNDTDNEEYQPEQRRRKPMTNRQENRRMRSNEMPLLTNFKGKLTKFDKDGSAAETTLPTLPPVAANSEAGMHPSWIAKQKLKPKIAAFTGTKIKFDD